MRNKTVYAILAIFLIQALSASLAVIPNQSDTDLFFPESSDTSARNNSSSGGNNSGNNTGGGNATGGGNNTGGGNSTECTPWNNVECNDEFGCSAGERIPILAIDESGEVMLDSDGNQIEVWGCSESSSEEGEDEAREAAVPVDRSRMDMELLLTSSGGGTGGAQSVGATAALEVMGAG